MKHLAPYQIFFPLGILNALLAVGIWFTRDLGWFSTPAMLVHSRLIVGGFLWSFICGFLMTAIPRMTGTQTFRVPEFVLALFLVFAQMIGAWFVDGRWFYGASALLIVFILFYGGRRLVKSTKPVPVFFSHVGLGMFLALTGSLFSFSGDLFMGIHLYVVGGILLLVLGIGTRFFSFLSGLPSAFETAGRPALRMMFHGLGISVAALLFVAGKGYAWAYLALSLLMFVYLGFVWKIFRWSDRPSALKLAVRFVACLLPLCFFLSWLAPAMYVTWFHLLFIGCFALMTFSVATRVTLAHGSYPIDFEMRSRALWWVVSFMGMALISRVLYGFTVGLTQKSFLHLAACFWFLAILCWCFSFFMRILKQGQQARPSCG